MPGYLVAGKTGTAAKADPHGGYSDTNYVASFVGIVPASTPRLVILVSIDEPRGQIFGGLVAAPAFRDIARFALQYMDVPPDDPARCGPPALGRLRLRWGRRPAPRFPWPPPRASIVEAVGARVAEKSAFGHFGDDWAPGGGGSPC